MNNQKRTKLEIILIICLSIAGILFIVASIYIATPKGPFFKNLHFDYWQIDYPSSEPLTEYQSESIWFGERFDYVVYPTNKEVQSNVEGFLNKTDHNITSKGTINDSEIDINEVFYLGLEAEDREIFENRISNYDGFEYWTLTADDDHQMAIYLSDNEVIFLFRNS